MNKLIPFVSSLLGWLFTLLLAALFVLIGAGFLVLCGSLAGTGFGLVRFGFRCALNLFP